MKTVGSKLLSKTAKKAVTKVSEHAGNKAGDKIIKLLRKKNKTEMPPTPTEEDRQLTDYEINESKSTVEWWKTPENENNLI